MPENYHAMALIAARGLSSASSLDEFEDSVRSQIRSEASISMKGYIQAPKTQVCRIEALEDHRNRCAGIDGGVSAQQWRRGGLVGATQNSAIMGISPERED